MKLPLVQRLGVLAGALGALADPILLAAISQMECLERLSAMEARMNQLTKAQLSKAEEPSSGPYLTRQEAMDLLGIGSTSLWEYEQAKVLTAIPRLGKVKRYHKADIEAIAGDEKATKAAKLKVKRWRDSQAVHP